MKITPSGKSPETLSETLFAAYLNDHKYNGWLFEPVIEGSSRHPDFMVPFAQQALLFDVKERRRKGGEPRFAFIDPMAGIREEIEEARRKFKSLKNFPCSLVIYNAGDIDTLLKPEYVFGAMLGDPGFTVGYDDAKGCLLPETGRNVFLPQGGKMMRYKTGEIQNTTINAMIVLERRLLPDRYFERTRDEAIRSASRASGATLSEPQQRLIAVRLYRERKVRERVILRVRACEHPSARIPLPWSIFRGAYDERWALVRGEAKRVWSGSKIPDLESH